MKTRMSNRDIGADTDTNTGQVYQYTETEHRGGGGGKRPRRQLRRFVSSKLQFSSVQPALLQLARRPLQLRIERLDQVQQAALGSRGGGADILRDATEGEFEACDGC